MVSRIKRCMICIKRVVACSALGLAVHGFTFTMQKSAAQNHVAQGTRVAFQVNVGEPIMVERSVIEHFPVLARMFESAMSEGLTGKVHLKKRDGTPCSDTTVRLFTALFQTVAPMTDLSVQEAQSLKSMISNARLSTIDLSELSLLIDMYHLEKLYDCVAREVVHRLSQELRFFRNAPDNCVQAFVLKYGLFITQKSMNILAEEELKLHRDNFTTALEKFSGRVCYQSPEMIITVTCTPKRRVVVWRYSEEEGNYTLHQEIDGQWECISDDGKTLVVKTNQRRQLMRYDDDQKTYSFNDTVRLPALEGRTFGRINFMHISDDANELMVSDGCSTIYMNKNEHNEYIFDRHLEGGDLVPQSVNNCTMIVRNNERALGCLLYKKELPLGELDWAQTLELLLIQQMIPQGGLDYERLPEESRQRHKDIFASLNPELRQYLRLTYAKNV